MANKILVVDDDLNICELLKLYLENDGYVVYTANDGKQAVEIPRQPRIRKKRLFTIILK